MEGRSITTLPGVERAIKSAVDIPYLVDRQAKYEVSSNELDDGNPLGTDKPRNPYPKFSRMSWTIEGYGLYKAR